MTGASGSEKLCKSAAAYSIGALDAVEMREFEQHLAGCAACAAEVPDFSDAVTALALDAVAEPPPHLRQKLLDRINAPAARVRRDEGEWTALPFEGIEVKQMFADPASGNVTSMVKLAPGARYPGHFHAGLEHCYVLEGDLVFEDHVLYAGDYEVAAVHTEHSSVTTNGGCLLLLINNVHDQVHV